jgi:predicted ATPase
VYAVAPLPLAGPQEARSPERLTQYAAVALFIERAQDARSDFQVTAVNAPAIADICARLDGLPLAIELAAARVRLLPPEALLARLAGHLQLLSGGARDAEERQQTMRATLTWSDELLSPQEQVLFRRLAVCVGGCTLEAAETVCSTPARAAPLDLDVLEGEGALVDQSLVQQREEDGEPRFGMLHVIREYALERLATSGEAEAVRRAHAAYYLALAEQAESTGWGPTTGAWLERLEREHDNLRAALGWARARGEVATGLRLAGALADFWWVHGHLSEGRGWLESLPALAQPPAAAPRARAGSGRTSRRAHDRGSRLDAMRAKALYGTANLATWQGDYSRAVLLAEQSLALARTAGPDALAAFALNRLGLLTFYKGEPERAVAQLEESLALARRADDPVLFVGPLLNLGYVAFYQGDLVQAAARFEESLARARQAGIRFNETLALMSLGNLARRQGDLARATTRLREGLSLARQLKDPRVVAETLEYLAMTAATADEAERAAAMLGAAAALRQTHGIPQPPPERADTAAAVVRARAALGESAWQTAFATGQALSLEEAIAQALGEAG